MSSTPRDCFLTCSGFIVSRLTGECTCDFTQAYGYHFFDIRRERWCGSTAAALGVPLEKMPRLAAADRHRRDADAEAAAALGLRAGIPVIVGCLDAAAGALGAGVTRHRADQRAGRPGRRHGDQPRAASWSSRG